MAARTIVDLVIDVRTMTRDNNTDPTKQAFPDLTGADGKPIPGSNPELRAFVADAVVNHYSRWRPRRIPYTLQIKQRQVQYQLPADWITVDDVTFNKAKLPIPLPDPDVYTLPFGYTQQPLGAQVNTMEFHWYDSDQLLIVGSPPLSDYSLTFDYFAMHQADDSKVTVPIQEQHYALLPAAEHALRALAADYGVKLQKYKIGGRYGIEVDDSKIAENLIKMADNYDEQFRKDVIQRPYATSGGGDS